jgi:TatD DNase family protein
LHPGNIKDSTKENPVGALPENIRENDFNFQLYEELAQSQKAVAVGEIGLDYFYKPKTDKKFEEMKARQIEVFKAQLDFAREMNLPVVLHCRAAHGDLIEILKNDFGANGKLKGVVHCFTGGMAELKEYLGLGLHIGLDGIIFKMDLDEVIKKISPARILLETDCPYLTPHGAPEKRNDPRNIKIIAQRISQIRNEPLESLAAISTQNAKELFGI